MEQCRRRRRGKKETESRPPSPQPYTTVFPTLWVGGNQKAKAAPKSRSFPVPIFFWVGGVLVLLIPFPPRLLDRAKEIWLPTLSPLRFLPPPESDLFRRPNPPPPLCLLRNRGRRRSPSFFWGLSLSRVCVGEDILCSAQDWTIVVCTGEGGGGSEGRNRSLLRKRSPYERRRRRRTFSRLPYKDL